MSGPSNRTLRRVLDRFVKIGCARCRRRAKRSVAVEIATGKLRGGCPDCVAPGDRQKPKPERTSTRPLYGGLLARLHYPLNAASDF
jgi:hypothetical protein